MATKWSAARAAIASILGAVIITEPVGMQIAKVYETEPQTIGDFPCAIIMGYAMHVQRGAGLRIKTYQVRLRLVVREASLARKQELLEAFAEASITAFDGATRLGLADNYHVIEGPNWEEPHVLDAGGINVGAMDGILVLELKDAVAFAP